MQTKFIQVETETEAFAQCEWAAACKEVEGGYICFESVTDAAI